jgi:endonuclease V-like protein UPF0215 family
VSRRLRPHLLGIDDAPFEKGQAGDVPIVGVMMEGADLVEGVATTSFPVDGDAASDFLASWVCSLRLHANLQGVVLGGITIAGLGLVDLRAFARLVAVPVLAVTRREPENTLLIGALRAARLSERIPTVERSPHATRIGDGLFLACAGTEPSEAARLVQAAIGKARLPEPLRVAHLIARALVSGESRGRV